VARMSSIEKLREIMAAVTIPVMAKCRIGHFAEAQMLQALGVDYVDESEVLTPADERYHVDKFAFEVPFVCGCRDLGEALRRIGEGAAMIRTKGEAGSGNIVEAVRHMRAVMDGIRKLVNMPVEELMAQAKEMGAPFELVVELHKTGKLPVVNFAAGGVATPADAALMMQLGADGVFVGGCHIGDCHYIAGNQDALRRTLEIESELDSIGINPDRFLRKWISASEGAKFAALVNEMTEQIKKIGPSPFRVIN